MDVGPDILSFVSLGRKQSRNTADFLCKHQHPLACQQAYHRNLHSMLYKVTLGPSVNEMQPHLQRIFISSVHNTGYCGINAVHIFRWLSGLPKTVLESSVSRDLSPSYTSPCISSEAVT